MSGNDKWFKLFSQNVLRYADRYEKFCEVSVLLVEFFMTYRCFDHLLRESVVFIFWSSAQASSNFS